MKGAIYLSFPGLVGIEVKGDFTFDVGEMNVLACAYLPGVLVSEDEIKADVVVEYVESDERRVERNGEIFRIFDNWGGHLSLDVWHFLYSIVRLYLLKKRLYPVHAACVGKEEHALLVGHSGSGKSTILLKLLSDFGWTVFSGDKTVVSLNESGMEAVAGTRSISIRSADSNIFPNLSTNIFDFQGRSACILGEEHYSKNKTAAISRIFIVKLNDGVSDVKMLHHPSDLHTLYPYVLDVVNADTILCDGLDIFMGTPPMGSQATVIRDLKKSLSKIKVINITGSLDFVVNNIVGK